MGELRDLIEQRIAEVRAQRATTPAVVQVKGGARTGKLPKRQASRAGGAAAAPVAMVADAPATGLASADVPQAPGKTGLLGREVPWAYSGDTGPANWGLLKPEFQACLVGRRQSPIDLRDGIPVQLDPIKFDYRPGVIEVSHRDHTVVAVPEPGQGVQIGGQRYELLHIAFRNPGEVIIDGQQAPMSVHLYHRDAAGQLAVIAVGITPGEANDVVQQVWNNLPLERDLSQRSAAAVDLSALLPASPQHYTYMGSLTTPPCTEGVLWAVMRQPVSVSLDQMGVLARLYPYNGRPAQPTHGRLIKAGQ